jgi:LemA protein
MTTHPVLIVVTVMIVLTVCLPLAWYNKLVRLRQLIKESWGNIDVQLRRRYDLISNFVNAVKGYAGHERATLDAVIEARNKAQANTGDVAAKAQDEQNLVRATRQLFALAEAYPDLKASEGFLQLQQELVNTEDRIAAARRFYNSNARDYNIKRTTFPYMLVVRFGDFPAQEYFEVDDFTRAAPVVAAGV